MEDCPVWLITGAGSGFGRALSVEAMSRGARVIATARDPARLVDLGPNSHAVELDVRDPRQIQAVVAGVEHDFGRIDVLVNAAGYGLIAAVEEARPDEIEDLYATHLFGPLALIRAVLPGMRSRRTGHIINFSSVAGLVSSAGTALYASAKSAIEGLSEGLAKELKPLGICVLIVEPGPFQTDFFTRTRRMGAERIDDYDRTAGEYRRRAGKADPWLPGDPERGAKIIADSLSAADPPLRLLLGQFAVNLALKTFEDRLREAHAWSEWSHSADRPEAAGREWP